MSTERQRPIYYSPRSLMRQRELPDLYSSSRPPTLAQTTSTEIQDAEIGLTDDPVAQRRAVEYINASLAFRARQATTAMQEASVQLAVPAETLDGIVAELTRITRRSRFTPRAILIADAADDTDDDVMLPDVVESMTPVRSRFDG